MFIEHAQNWWLKVNCKALHHKAHKPRAYKQFISSSSLQLSFLYPSNPRLFHPNYYNCGEHFQFQPYSQHRNLEKYVHIANAQKRQSKLELLSTSKFITKGISHVHKSSLSPPLHSSSPLSIPTPPPIPPQLL